MRSGRAGVAAGIVRGISADDSLVYWMDVGNAAIRSVPIAGGGVTTIATGLNVDLNRPSTLVLSAGTLYWTESGTTAGCCLVAGSGVVRSAPAGGGLVTTLQAGLDEPGGLAVDDAGNVVWTEAWRVARLASGNSRTIASGIATRMARIAVDDANVYVLDGDYIKRVPITGGIPERLTWSHGTSLGDISVVNQDIVTDGSNVYWTTLSGLVHSVPVSGGTSVVLNPNDATGFSLPECYWRLVVDHQNLYWSAPTSTGGIGCSVKTVPVSGGDVRTLVDVPYLEDFAVDGTRLYYAELGTNPGSIETVPLAGGSPSLVASNVAVDVLAQDDRNVYWLDFSSSSGIYAIAKNGANGSQTRLFPGPLDTDPSLEHDALLVVPGTVFFSQAADGALIAVPNN